MRYATTGCALYLLSATLSAPLWAQGYVLDELSARRLGDAFSGGAAEARDATTVYYNPAGLIRLKQQDLVAGASVLNNSVEFSGGAVSGTADTAVTGDANFEYRSHDLVPHLYYAVPLKYQGVIGVGFNVPIASTTEFPEDSVVRYQNTESTLVGMRLTFSLAQPITDKLSVGAGFAMQQLEAESHSAVDAYVFCSQLGLPNCGTPANAANDGKMVIEADAMDWGVTAGVLYQWDDATRFGVAYRSRIEHDMEGELDLNVRNPVNASNLHLNSHAYLTMNSPAAVAISGYRDITPKLSVQADATWTEWSEFEALRVQTDLGLGLVQPQHWRNTWRFAVGGQYQVTDAWALRAGVASDPSPIPTAYRSLSFPMDDYRALSLGTSYAFTPAITLDAALQRTAPFSSTVRDGDLETQGGESLGVADGSTWSLAMGVSSRF